MNDLGNKQTTVCSDYLEAVKSINTDKALSNTERLSACIEELNNPYCFLCGKTLVKVVFNEDAPTLDFLLDKLLQEPKKLLKKWAKYGIIKE